MWCANCGECIWAIVIEFCRKILQQDPKSNPESNPIQRSQPLHIQMIAKSEFQTTYPKIQNQRCSTPHEHCWWNHFQSGKSTGIVLAQGFHPFHYSKRRGSPPSRRLSKWIGRSEIKKKSGEKTGEISDSIFQLIFQLDGENVLETHGSENSPSDGQSIPPGIMECTSQGREPHATIVPMHGLFGWWFGTWLLFFHVLGIIIPTDFHIFQRGWNHQPVMVYSWFEDFN